MDKENMKTKAERIESVKNSQKKKRAWTEFYRMIDRCKLDGLMKRLEIDETSRLIIGTRYCNFEGLTQAEVGKIYRLSESAVRYREQKAMKIIFEHIIRTTKSRTIGENQ
jgi:DNA-directed RNA polymerase specialized sigma subunit